MSFEKEQSNSRQGGRHLEAISRDRRRCTGPALTWNTRFLPNRTRCRRRRRPFPSLYKAVRQTVCRCGRGEAQAHQHEKGGGEGGHHHQSVSHRGATRKEETGVGIIPLGLLLNIISGSRIVGQSHDSGEAVDEVSHSNVDGLAKDAVSLQRQWMSVHVHH